MPRLNDSVGLMLLASAAASKSHWMNSDERTLGNWGAVGHNIEQGDMDGSEYLVMMCSTGMREVPPPF